MTTPKQQNSFPLRMPDGLRPALELRAQSNGRSANAEIVAILTAALDAPAYLAVVPLEVLLAEVVTRVDAKIQIVIAPEAAAAAGIETAD